VIDRIVPCFEFGSKLEPAPWRMLAQVCLLAMVATGLTACESSNDENEIILPPIAVSSTYPDVLAPVDTEINAITFNFNLPPRRDEITSIIYPKPPEIGVFEPTSSTRTTWSWTGYELDETAGGYHVMVDGIEMAQPYVLSFGVSAERLSDTGLGGQIDSRNYTQADPVEAVVFAVTLGTSFSPNLPETWFDAVADGDILAVTSLEDDNFGVDEPLRYRFSYLEEDRRYYVVAIADTNGDLEYDPRDDWWDYSRNPDGGFAGFVAQTFGDDDKETPEVAVDLRLRPPGAN